VTSYLYFGFTHKFLEVLTNEFPNVLPPCRKVDHKIEVAPRMALLSKAPYRLN